MLFERISYVQMHYKWTGRGREKHGLKLSGHNDMYMYTKLVMVERRRCTIKMLFREPKM